MHGLRLETENSLFLKPVNFGLSNFVKKTDCYVSFDVFACEILHRYELNTNACNRIM